MPPPIHKTEAERSAVVLAAGSATRALVEHLPASGSGLRVVEALLLHSQAALVAVLGAKPGDISQNALARSLAMRAYWRARSLQNDSSASGDGSSSRGAGSATGVGCAIGGQPDAPHSPATESLCIALQTDDFTETWSRHGPPPGHSPDERDRWLARWLCERVGQLDRRPPAASASTPSASPPAASSGESVERPEMRVSRAEALGAWRDLMLGRSRIVPASPEHAHCLPDLGTRRLVFPGAFNPRHAGHLEMAELAGEAWGLPVEYEISIENVDKPPLNYEELSRRVTQFAEGEILWLTRAATFARKAELFPAATFLVGADTIARVADPRYYGSTRAFEAAMRQLAQHQCRFLVFGRQGPLGFRELRDLPLPPPLARLCDGVPGDRFRADICSTQIRRARGGKSPPGDGWS